MQLRFALVKKRSGCAAAYTHLYKESELPVKVTGRVYF